MADWLRSIDLFIFVTEWNILVTLVLTSDVNAVAAGTTDDHRLLPLRRSSSSSTAVPLVTVTDVQSTNDSNPTTNIDGRQTAVKRSVSNLERGSTERRSRPVGVDAVDSSSNLLELLAAGDAALGNVEFVRSASQRNRRRLRPTLDAVNDSRERVTPSPTGSSLSATTDDDDPCPSLSRGGPGRWSLRERATSSRTSSPPLSSSAGWSKYRAAQINPEFLSSSVSHSIGGAVTGNECLLDRSDYSLDQRRQLRLQQRSVSPVTRTSDLDDRQRRPSLPTSGRLTRWSPTITDVSESSESFGNCLRRDQIIDAEMSHLQRSTSDVDRVIHDVEKTGKEIDSVISGAAVSSTSTISSAAPKPQRNVYQTPVNTQQVETPEIFRNGCPGNETRCRIFDDDEEDEPIYLQRSATLPRRWRYEKPRRRISNVDDYMEQIPEFPPGQTNSHGAPGSPEAALQRSQSDTAASKCSTRSGATVEAHSRGSVDGAQLGASSRRTLPEIPGVSSAVPSTNESLMLDMCEFDQTKESDNTLTDETTATSRPTSAEFDAASISSGSRDEGFESALDNGGQSACSSDCSYPDFDTALPGDQPPSSPRELIGNRVKLTSDATTPCDGDDSLSSGTAFFARSIDSLVLPHQELVLSGETIDIDNFDADSSASTNSKDAQSASVRVATDKGLKQSSSNQKTGSSRSSLLSSLTARLSRPKKSTSSVPQTGSSTGKPNGADAKQSAPSSTTVTRTAGSSSGTAAGTGTKSSTFVRGSMLRATMPATLRIPRTKKSTESSAVSRNSEQPQRTTSSRDGNQTAHRPSPVSSRQQKIAAPRQEPSSGARKSHGELTAKADKQMTQKSASLPVRSRVAAGEQSRDQDKARSEGSEVRGGHQKLVLYKVVDKIKSPAAALSNTSSSSSSKKQSVNANTDAHRTQRLVSFNAPQQSRKFQF